MKMTNLKIVAHSNFVILEIMEMDFSGPALFILFFFFNFNGPKFMDFFKLVQCQSHLKRKIQPFVVEVVHFTHT